MKQILIIAALLITMCALSLAQEITTDTTGTNVAAYAAGQRICGPLTGKTVLVMRVPKNENNVTAIKGSISWVALGMDSISAGTVEAYAFQDTAGMWPALVADHAVFQWNDACEKNKIGSVSIVLKAQGTQAAGTTGMTGETAWNHDYELKYGTLDRIYWVLVARSAITPGKNGFLSLSAYITPKEPK